MHTVALSARRRTMMDIAVMYGAPWHANVEKAVQVRDVATHAYGTRREPQFAVPYPRAWVKMERAPLA